jgi:hypothetical protein
MVLVTLAQLLESTTIFDLNWSPAEQRLVSCLLSKRLPNRGCIAEILKISDSRLCQLTRDIMSRLTPLAEAIQNGDFDLKNVRTWPIALLKLDEGRRYGRRIEKKLVGRNITMVAQLLGHESPLAKPEYRKGLGKRTFDKLEEKLKPYGHLDELAWKLSVRNFRRVMQADLERRIQELNRRASAQ